MDVTNATKRQNGFWSGETLKGTLPELVKPFHESNIDCAAYTLSIGHELYISPSDQTPDPQSITKRTLADGESFSIPPGQFAFLLTEEIVKVPNDALGLISMKAKIKFLGLVNISGFHVDLGYEGQLTFSVFNAGPAPVHLHQGLQCFLIWYASLDLRSNYIKREPVHKGLDVMLINKISGEVYSLKGLDNKVKSVQQSLSDRIHAVEVAQASFSAITSFWIPIVTAVISAIIGGVIVYSVTNVLLSKPNSQPASQSTNPSAAVAATGHSESPLPALSPRSSLPTPKQ